MRRIRTLIGMPVVCKQTKVGRVLQADLNADLCHLEGIWVSAGFHGTRFIDCESLEMLGQAAVMSENAGTRRHLRPSALFRRAISTDGSRIGAITGAEIDELSFSVVALELSLGILDDLIDHRRRVTRYTVNRETGEVIVELHGEEWEERQYEKRTDQGADYRHADRRNSGDPLWHNELADGEKAESGGQAHRQLDLGQGG